MKLQSTCIISALFGAAIFLAGCGGAQTPSAASLPSDNVGNTGLAPQNQNRQGRCQDGNVKVHPCRITFNAANPGPITVSLGGSGDKHAIKERDNCASGGVATITKVNDRHYTAAAGATTGSCTARFSNGGGQGDAGILRIVNDL